MRLIIILFVFVSGFAFADFTVTPVPDWVLPVSKPLQEQEVEGYAVHYHLVDRQRLLTEDNQWTSFRHFIEEPLNQDGLIDVGKLNINYSPSYEQIQLHHLKITRDGVVMDKLKTARIEEINVEPSSDSEQITETKQIFIIIDDLKLGDTLDYAYSAIGSNPVFGKALSTSFQTGWSIPVDGIFTRLLTPASYKLNVHTQNTDQQPIKTQSGNQTAYEWQQTPAPVVFPENDMPEDILIYPMVQYSFYQSWPEVANWATELFALKKFQPNSQWSSWLTELQKLPTKDQQAVAALKIVQDRIRYVGIEVGENSHRPHPPNETLTLGYGDCKDKTLLLVSLLNALDIEAHPALVHSELGLSILNTIPSPKIFDHVITRVEIAGQVYWIDPTKSYQAGTALEDVGYKSLGVALPVWPEANLEKMPWQQGKRSKIEVRETYRSYGYQVPVWLKVVSTYSGTEADYKRRQLLNNGLREIENDYLNYYDKAYSGARVMDKMYYRDDRDKNELEVVENYWLERFWKWSEKKGRFEYRIEASAFGSLLKEPDQLRRKHPWGQRLPKHIVQKVDIFYPEYLNAAGLIPMDYLFEDDYFKFEVHNQELGHVSRYQFNYLNYKDRVAAEDIRRHTDLLDEANSHMSYTGWVNSDLNRQNKNIAPWFQRIESSATGEVIE